MSDGKVCTTRLVSVEETVCREIRSLSGMDSVAALDRDLPAEYEYYKRVPVALDLGQPIVFLWVCSHWPQIRFRTAQEAALLCECEGYAKEGRLFVEVYEFAPGSRRRPPSLEWAYKVEMSPLLAEPLGPVLDRDGEPIEEED